MLHPVTLRAFQDELTKIAALSAAQKVEQHHLDPDWKSFEKNLKGAKFRQAASSHPKSDSKLQAYIKSFGGYLSSKKTVGQVPSSTSAKKHRIKELEGGRLGCSCKDWQYKHSHQGTDCKHIQSHRQGKTKMSSVTMHAFRDELEKIAARRGLKEIRKAVAAKEHGRAASLAKTPGVLKPTSMGHQVKDLGQGSEGLATMVAGPEHGLAVRKTFDPRGLSTPEMIKRKEQAGRAIQSPNVAQFYGSHQTPGGLTAHMSEFVPGSAPANTPQNYAQIQQARKAMAQGARKAGFAGAADVRPGNMVQTPEGVVKAIDYMPVQRGEVASGNLKSKLHMESSNIVPMTDKPLFRDDAQSRSASEIKAHAFRGPLHWAAERGVASRPKAGAPQVGPGVAPRPNANAPTKPMKPPQLAPNAPTRVVPPPAAL